MMTAIFALLTLALALAWLRRGRIAAVFLFASLALAASLFLFEIHSPDYGFRMPWIRVQAPVNLPAAGLPAAGLPASVGEG